MPSYFIWTVGCQMNQADSERLGAAFEELGYSQAPNAKSGDIVVLNTCSVRKAAEDRAVNQLHLLKGLKKQKPSMTVAMVGCMVPKDSSNLKKEFPFVDVFCRPEQFEPLLNIAGEKIGAGEGCIEFSIGNLPIHHPTGPTAFVPISHGCNKVCSFCVIPYRRGTEVSRPLDVIVHEVEVLVSRGVREVTLLGQNVDSYGGDLPDRPDLADLLERLDDIDDLWRVRFLTSHPRDMSDKLIDAVGRLSKACEHINLPVQSGDDEILRVMRRGYTAAEYQDLVGKIRSRIPGVSIATDIIVGYPGELESAFQNTYDLIAALKLDVVHVAAYSPRPGTLAARSADDVPLEEKRRRLQLIEGLLAPASAKYNAGYIGKTVDVLVENRVKDKWSGRTQTNKLVFFDADGDPTGSLVQVEIERAGNWSLQGRLATPVPALA